MSTTLIPTRNLSREGVEQYWNELAAQREAQRIVDHHTDAGIGNGTQPDFIAREIKHLDSKKRPVFEIAAITGTSRSQVMATLNVDYTCAGCDRPADYGIHGIDYDGDDRKVAVTDCHGEDFIKPDGSVLSSDPDGHEPDWAWEESR